MTIHFSVWYQCVGSFGESLLQLLQQSSPAAGWGGNMGITWKKDVCRNGRGSNWFYGGYNLWWAVAYACMLLEGVGFPCYFLCWSVVLYTMYQIETHHGEVSIDFWRLEISILHWKEKKIVFRNIDCTFIDISSLLSPFLKIHWWSK